MWSDVAIYYRIKSTKKNGGFVKFFGAFLILLVISMQFGGANMLGVARAQIDGTTVVDPATPPAANETTVPASDPVVAPPAPEEAPAPAVDIPIDTPVTPPAADTTTPEENNQVKPLNYFENPLYQVPANRYQGLPLVTMEGSPW